jgi:hypothetical protein
MEKFKIKLVKWLANKFGYKIAMVKMGHGKISIQGNIELIKYCDVVGYTTKMEPLKRDFSKLKK